ncbi:ubiquinone biosynthesis regulatory protein kinase UbiB [Halioxenophilus sp. WMMB6]|uniref:ubiquinone biosynthesis regulatory protein kinase UbiB n=1 Tax=Halioxenophilus sp. WMMB6 TaxID=3073815 RepID=UPI00295E2DD6|nr:ubiquinone biosynthesis regulatory protein kinase UbiB [Halioxenophilus sp. WMMB6]
MLALFRILQILHAALKFRLDTFIDRRRLPWLARVLTLPLAWLPTPATNRGERLCGFFEHMGPVFVKFGQLLSTRPDLMPPDLVSRLDKLQDDVAPFPGERFVRLVEEALGAPVAELFQSFEVQPLASASVAQVHCAVLADGRQVVVKAIRPELEPIIEKDIALLRVVAWLIQHLSEDGRRLHLPEVVEDYRNTILDELDLLREAANASQLRRNFTDSPLLYVPEVYWPYCRRNVMVMERIYGIPVTQVAALKAQHTDMRRLAERGVEIFFTQVFEHNFFHADMHPGNIFVSTEHPRNPQYIAVDMAVVGSLSREDQYYLARNILAMFRRDYRQVAELHVFSGWVAADTSVGELEAAIRSVCEPIFERPLAEISFGQVLITLFQTARRFNMEVQPQLVLLQKTLLNIEGLGRQLYPELDLWATAHPYMEKWLRDRFHPKALLRELKRYGPEWMEKFPQVPHLLFNNLERFVELAEMAPSLKQASNAVNQQQRKKRNKLRFIWLPLAAAAGLAAFPAAWQWFLALPWQALALAASAAAAWLLLG